jgi:Cu+-exporting ATPase
MTAAKLLPMVQAPGAVDPVCGMTVELATAKFSTEHRGKRYYFCCGGCQAKFTADPQRYLAAAGRSEDRPLHSSHRGRGSSDPPQDVEYTCPMHPEVRQIGPGSCPLCGMALEPVVLTAEEPANEELVDMTRRFRVSVALTAPVALLAMSEMVPGWPMWPRLACALDPVPAGHAGRALGWRALLGARLAIGGEPQPEHVHADCAGVGVAYLFSVVATLALGSSAVVPHVRRRRGGVFEAAAVIVVLVQLGQVLS